MSDWEIVSESSSSQSASSLPPASVPSSSDWEMAPSTAKPAPAGTVNTFLGNMPKPTGNMIEDMRRLSPEMFPRNEQEKALFAKNQRERSMGALQSLANYPVKIANLFRQNPMTEFDFAPHTEQAQRGALAGDIGSYFLPGGIANLGVKGLTLLPKVGEGINALSKAAPWLKTVLNIGKAGGEAGLYGKTHGSENPMLDVGLGSGAQTAASLLTTSNPLARYLGALTAGGIAGHYAGDHPYYGAMAALAAPSLVRAMGLGSQSHIAPSILEGLEPKDVTRRLAAAQRLGTNITPAQASGNYVTAGVEGNLKRTPQGAQYAYRQEEAQTRSQQQAINRMLDNIYKPSPEAESKINELYAKAYKQNVNPNVIEKMKNETPVMQKAFDLVKQDPVYSNIPQNNYEFLAEVDRTLQRMKDGAQPSQEYVIGNIKKQYNEFLKEANDDYKAATAAAQPRIVRNSIENKLNKNEEDFTGKNFYSRFLNSKGSMNDLLRQTKNFPEAQAAIKDMKVAWKHLSNMKSVSQGEAMSKAGLQDARNDFIQIKKNLERMAGGVSDKQALKFIYSKDWDKGFDQIMQMQEGRERNRALLSLFGKMAVMSGLQ